MYHLISPILGIGATSESKLDSKVTKNTAHEEDVEQGHARRDEVCLVRDKHTVFLEDVGCGAVLGVHVLELEVPSVRVRVGVRVD
jgi:hypothetical protein